jgi:hypothetical protein
LEASLLRRTTFSLGISQEKTGWPFSTEGDKYYPIDENGAIGLYGQANVFRSSEYTLAMPYTITVGILASSRPSDPSQMMEMVIEKYKTFLHEASSKQHKSVIIALDEGINAKTHAAALKEAINNHSAAIEKIVICAPLKHHQTLRESLS